MNEDEVTIDAICQIKGKLLKYSQRKPDPEKVNNRFRFISRLKKLWIHFFFKIF
jgi:hypothetical protein